MEKRRASLLVLTLAAALTAGCMGNEKTRTNQTSGHIIDRPVGSIAAGNVSGADIDRLQEAQKAEQERPVSHAESIATIRDKEFVNSSILDPLLLDKLDLYLVWKTPVDDVNVKNIWAMKDLVLFYSENKDNEDYKLYAVNVADGYVRWLYDFVSPIDSRPTYNNGIVWVSSANTVSPLAANDGGALWKTRVPFTVNTPIFVVGKRQYIGTLDKSVYAVSGDDQYPDWDFSTFDIISAMPLIDHSNNLYVASEDGTIYAYDFATDENIWHVATGAPIVADFVSDKNFIYVGSEDFNLYCISKATGHVTWKFPCQGPVRTPVRLLNDTTVLVKGADSYFYAINTETGTELWRDRDAKYPVAKGKYLYVYTRKNTIKALDMKTGEAAWEQSVAPFSQVPANLETDAITLCTPDGNMCLIQEIDGKDLAKVDNK